MTNKDDTKTATTTEVKTMWSETLLEALYVALEKKVGDAHVRELLGELKAKGYKKDYLIEKVTKKLGPNAVTQLERVYGSGVTAASAAPAGKKQESGLVGKIKSIFK